MRNRVLSLGDLLLGYPLDNGFYRVQQRDFAVNTIQDISNYPSSKIENIAKISNMHVFMLDEGMVTWISKHGVHDVLTSFVSGALVDEMLDIVE